MEKVVVLGGGISGLSCLNALLDNGVDALLIEGNEIGSPKMCGEFLAPEAVSLLNKWLIGPIVPITNAEFFVDNKNIKLSFPKIAGAMARSDVETSLAKRAKKLGGRIREKTLVSKNIPSTSKSPHIIELKSGEKIEADTVFFAAGRFAGCQSNFKAKYLGMKLHFKPKYNPSNLQMYCFKGAYLGVVPISNVESNCALLINRKVYGEQPMDTYFKKLLSSQPRLKELFGADNIYNPTKIEGVAPSFGLKQYPDWPRSYWIGDAFATIYPAVGSGFSHGIQSAILAVECFNATKAKEFRKENLGRIKPILHYGKWINYILQNPKVAKTIMPLLNNNPKIINLLLNKIGYS